MPIVIEDKARCAGCMACVAACPVDAIHPTVDENGFTYPLADTEKCIKCGLCRKVCDFTKAERGGQKPLAAYSLVHQDKSTLKGSTSGGAFTALSDVVLAEGGAVVGARMYDDLSVRHTVATTQAERDAMRGSLYVQSDVGDSYRRVRELLQAGTPVMFVGTPCQAAGLRSFLGKSYAHLTTVEFLCHGVPNQQFLGAHIAWLEGQYGKKAAKYSFRSKRYSWNPSGIEEITFADGTARADRRVQAYHHFFHANVSLRPSCMQCSYCRAERGADLTICDFWDLEAVTGQRDHKGVSLVFANTAKGMAVLESTQNVCCAPVPVDRVLYRTTPPTPISKYSRDEFWALYRKGGYPALVSRYFNMSFKVRLRHAVKKAVRSWQGRRGARR